MNGSMSGQACNHEWGDRTLGGVQCKRCGLVGSGTALQAIERHQAFIDSYVSQRDGMLKAIQEAQYDKIKYTPPPIEDHVHRYGTRRPVSPTSVERVCSCGKVRGMECQHQFVRVVNHDAIMCGGCGLAIPYLTLLKCPHHFTNELHPAVWMCARCHAPKDIVDQLCYAEPIPSNEMRALGNAPPDLRKAYEGLAQWVPPTSPAGGVKPPTPVYAGVDLSKVSMDPCDKPRRGGISNDPKELSNAIERIWREQLEEIKKRPAAGPEPSWPHPGPVPEHIKKQLAGPVPGPMMTDPTSGPLPVPGGPTISYDEYRKYRHGQMESGPGIEKLPVRPEPDVSSEMSDWDLLPDA